MRRLAWTFAARIGDKYQIRFTQPIFISEREKMNSKISERYQNQMLLNSLNLEFYNRNTFKNNKTVQKTPLTGVTAKYEFW